ncbi:predicted protein [Enterococcus faecalis T1]|nr:predicted protein [Enterococcus faecalis T1]
MKNQFKGSFPVTILDINNAIHFYEEKLKKTIK